MLKIRDDVDLKELEKYGFEFEEMYKGYVKYIDTGLHTIYVIVFVDNPNFEKGTICGNSNYWLDTNFSDERLLKLCEDLDKDGLIEKVEG